MTVQEHQVRIDHDALTDAFGRLAEHAHYVAFDATCADCHAWVCVTPDLQQWMLEVRGEPAKYLATGVRCHSCRLRLGRIEWLTARQRYLDVPGGAQELEELRAAARNMRRDSAAVRRWPYL